MIRPWLAFCLLAGSLHAQGYKWQVKTLHGLDYPPFARSAIIYGTVELLLTISDDGSVGNAEVRKGGSILAAAARANALTWRFEKVADGNSGVDQVTLIYEFKYNFDCDTTCPASAFSFEYPNRITVETSPRHFQP